MRVLVTGVKGQLGYDCVRELNDRGVADVLGIDKEELDITNEKAVKQFVQNFMPDVIIHCAAWTAVDKAEENVELVNKINVLGAKYLTESSLDIGAKLVYISTDYVFSGKGSRCYETDDEKNPLSVYGSSKLEGEIEVQKNAKHFIVRTSWVFGVNGNNFVKTMLKLAEPNKELTIVSDQIGSPTYTRDLAKLICDMIVTEKYGTYHATNEGICSWAEFASEIFKQADLNIKINPISTAEYIKQRPSQALRPLNSRLSKKSLDDAKFQRLPEWKDALSRYLKEIGVI